MVDLKLSSANKLAVLAAWVVLVLSIMLLAWQIEGLIRDNKTEILVTEQAVVDTKETACGTWQSLLYVLETQKILATNKGQRDDIQLYIDRFRSDYQIKCEFYELDVPALKTGAP